MAFIWWVLCIALLLVWALTIVDALNRNLTGGQTAAWLLIILLIPFFGSGLYWVIRPGNAEMDRPANM
jgi:hypothetical protein